jgi:plastocyanin
VAIAAATLAVVIGPSAALGGAHSASNHNVVLKNIRFHPATLRIHRGDTVTWLWRDSGTRHNVTSRHFHSGSRTSGSFSVRLTRPGTYRYECTIHVSSGMRGAIVVH